MEPNVKDTRSTRTTGKNGQSTICSYCGYAVLWRRYAKHLQVRHPNGRAYTPYSNRPRKSMEQLLSEGAKDGSLMEVPYVEED